MSAYLAAVNVAWFLAFAHFLQDWLNGYRGRLLAGFERHSFPPGIVGRGSLDGLKSRDIVGLEKGHSPIKPNLP